MSDSLPAQIYQQIDPAQFRRLFLVGDLHGCYDQLLEKLERQRFDRDNDLLISVGDIIDRGPKNLECLRMLREKWFVAVRGNHEQMAIDALASGDDRMWRNNGGNWFNHLSVEDRAEAAELIGLSAQLPLIIDIPMGSRHMVVSHADYPLNQYEYQQTVDTEPLLWSRRRVTRNQQGRGEPIAGASHFFFGHTPFNRVRHYFNQFYIDTGAVFGGSLTVLELNSLPF